MSEQRPNCESRIPSPFWDRAWIALWGVIGCAIGIAFVWAVFAVLFLIAFVPGKVNDLHRFPTLFVVFCSNIFSFMLWLVPIMWALAMARDASDKLNLDRNGLPDDLQDEACREAGRRYFNAHASKHLRPEHWKLISKHPNKHLSLSCRRWNREFTDEFEECDIPVGECLRMDFWIRDVQFPERLIYLLGERIKNRRSKCRVVAGPWYPDGDLKVSSERSVSIQHQSKRSRAEVASCFEPEKMGKWMSHGDARTKAEGDVIWVAVLQDHSFRLTVVETSLERIVYDQTFGRNHCRVIVELQENEAGTLISVIFRGFISIHLEEDYKDDWTIRLID